MWSLVAAAGFSAAANAPAQPYGLDSRAPIGPYLNGQMPALGSGSGDWAVAVAFPNLTFDDPVFLTHEPRTNRLYVLNRQGLIWFFPNDPNASAKTVFLDLRSRTLGWEACGLLGMAFHPEFNQPGSPNRRYVYVYYNYTPNPVPGPNPPELETPSFNRLSRFTVPDGSLVADPESELVLVNQYDRHIWHNGGSIFFGDDGFLYFVNGDEGGVSDPYDSAQRLDGGLFSGVFRIDVDRNPARSHPIRRQPQSGGGPSSPPSFTGNYFIPNDNPFLDPNGGVLEEFWALGFRSPHRMTFDPVTRRIWLGDVGQDYWEEVSLVERGGNYQWPFREGSRPGFKPQPFPLIGTSQPPLFDYPHEDGNNCVIGGYVYRGTVHASLRGKYIFGDNGSGRIWAVTYDGSGDPVLEYLCSMPPATTFTGLSSFGVDQNGELYLCKMGAGSRIYKLVRTTPPPPKPKRLSQTGAFSNVQTLTPAAGLIPYELNAPFWSDHAIKRRWMAVPNDGAPYSAAERIGFAPSGQWTFPAGTVFVKHFELPMNENNPASVRRLETRLLVREANGGVYGVTYRWRPDNSDADLLTVSRKEDFVIQTAAGGTRTQQWYYPSPQDCMTCHNDRDVLGVKTAQLNRELFYATTGRTDNQLRTLNHLQLFDPPLSEAAIPGYARMADVTNTNAPLELRVRSYLDANCAQCHRPNGVQAYFDTSFENPLAELGIINGTVGRTRGIAGAKVVAPGSLSQSLLYLRVNSTEDHFQMPPLARNEIDARGVALLAEWINSLPSGGILPTPWANTDIGAVGRAGNATYSGGGVFTVSGSGADIWGNADAFHFVHQSLNGDGEIVARVTAVQNTDGWAKAGVMIRESLEPGARNVLMLISPFNGAGFQRRLAANGPTAFTPGPDSTPPHWLRLVRLGNTFNAYAGSDGVNWTLVATENLTMDHTVYIGLAVTSHNNSELNASTFSDVRVTASGATGELPVPWLSRDIGSVGRGGSANYTNGVFTVLGSGHDIWDNADGFHFAYRTLTGDGEIIARVLSVEETDGWAKVGVMIRETLEPGSRNAMMLVSPTKGTGFQRRVSTGGGSTFTAGPNQGAPYWVRLVRSGETVRAYGSGDGLNWTLVGSDTLAMTATVLVGLAVTSHLDGVLNTTTFGEVRVTTGSAGGDSRLPASWLHTDIGLVGISGNAEHTNGIFHVSGSGADIWGAADGFHFVYQPLQGDGEIAARVVSVQNTEPWAKAGVMIRENLEPGARNAVVVMSPSQGSGFQRRITSNGATAFTAGPNVQAPHWVRLVRSGPNVQAFTGVDGVNWTLIGSEAIELPAVSLVGLAVTAHDNTLLNTSVFDNVRVGGMAMPPAARLTLVEFDHSGRILLRIEGEAGRSYRVEASSNFVNWSNVTTVENVSGPVLFLDPVAGTSPQRFYRTVLLD